MAKKKGSTSLHELFDEDGYANPSRSQLKRESAALQKIGEDLAELPKSVWNKFTLSPDLKDALEEYERIPSREGRRRQLQFIGRLMREENSQLIAQELSAYKLDGATQVESFHQLEALRDRLLDADSGTLQKAKQEVEDLFPHFNSKEFEQLVQTARSARTFANEHGAAKQDKIHSRALFRYLKNLQNSMPPANFA